MVVITPTFKYGAYSTIVVETKGIVCDGLWLPFSVIGSTYSIVSDDSLAEEGSPPFNQEDIVRFTKIIDSDIDLIYNEALGSRVSEYSLAEQEALLYKESGYTGIVPSTVQSWASIKSQTAIWAADNIIATAAMWRSAQKAMRTQRLQSKESAKASTTLFELITVANSWGSFVGYIRQQLGLS